MTEEISKTLGMETAVYVSWEESERGWGTRPDGCSLHSNEEEYKIFLENYRANMPKKVPHEYSRPAGGITPVLVSKELHGRIKASPNGIRLYNHEQRENEEEKNIIFGSERTGWRGLND